MILTDPEWQAVLLSLKFLPWLCCLACRLGSFLPGSGALHVSGQSSARQRTASTAVLPPVVVGYLLLVSMGRRGLSVNVCMTGLVLPSPLAGAARSRCRRHVVSADGAGNSSGAEGVDVKLEQAARTLGAGRWRFSLLSRYR